MIGDYMHRKLMVINTKKGKHMIAPKDMSNDELADAMAEEIMKDSADPNVYIPKKY